MRDPVPLAYAAADRPRRPPWFLAVPAGLVIGGAVMFAMAAGLRSVPQLQIGLRPVGGLLFPFAMASRDVFDARPQVTSLFGFAQYPVYFGVLGLGLSLGRLGRSAVAVLGIHVIGFAVWLLAS